MRFSIITPTLQRQSLRDTCASVDYQTYTDWEHLVRVDCDYLKLGLLHDIRHPQRTITQCERAHSNGGNTCRNEAYQAATGEYIIYLDDDNFLTDREILADIHAALMGANFPPFAIFPIDRLGGRFFSDPPRSCHTDTLNLVLHRTFAEWPDTTAYGSDGVLVEALMQRAVPYAAFPEFRSIGVIPKISFCK